ncbi:uncharacterized protein [Nicotiana tomentosiformis]|uniref:uncharacterized protein n=1 Tax=Nicotiana tomentosiformis TaxID=4098 RepID=UPI00388CAD71
MELRQTITALKCRLIEAFCTIDAMKAKIESLEDHVSAGVTDAANNVMVAREAKIEAPKPPVFKGVRNAQEVENFLWHLENYFNHGKVRDDEAMINTIVLYLSETSMLWWRRKMDGVDKGLCTISTWDQFKAEFKRQFFPNNVLYEARRKLRELKQTGNIRVYVKEFTTLMLQIPNLTNDDLLFHFMDGLQNWAKQELQCRQVADIDQAIVEAELLMDFRHDKHDKGKGKEKKFNIVKGGGDRGKGKEIQQQYYKTQDSKKSSGHQGYTEKKAQAEKKGCYLCGGPHNFRNCLDLKSLSAMVREQKEQPQAESSGTAQLAMIGLCGSVTKQAIQPTENGNQYMDLIINNKPARAMVDTGATHNFVIEAASKRLELKLDPTNSCIKTVNAEIQAQLSAMQVVKGIKKGELTFVETIISLE